VAVDVPEGPMGWRAMNPNGRKLHHVRLDDDGRALPRGIVDGGKGARMRRTRAHVLLPADESRGDGGRAGTGIADIPGVGTATVERVRRQCVPGGLDAAAGRREQANRKRPRLDGEGQATLAMPGCSEPPEGHARWTLQPRGDRLVELEVVDSIGKETVRQALKKKGDQALAEGMLVYPAEGERRIRRRHGGCARGLRTGV